MPTSSTMPNLGKHSGHKAEQRKSARYKVSPDFPIRASLSLADKSVGVNHAAASHGKVTLKMSSAVWKDWPGTLVDLSTTGANMHVNLAAVAFPEDPCRLKFSLGSYRLEIPATVMHFVSYSHYAVCGVQFNFPGAVSERAYQQVLEPVMIGTSLAPVDATQDGSGFFREQYAGKSSSLLTVMRTEAGGELVSFDFRLNRYGVRWSVGMSELNTYSVQEDKDQAAAAEAPKAAPKLKLKNADKAQAAPHTPTSLTEAQEEEARWLFCLAVSNLSNAVAEDVRKFLTSLVVA